MIDLLRYANITVIFLSVGFVIAIALKARNYSAIPEWTRGMAISYILFALGSASEIQLRIGQPGSWETILATVASWTAIMTCTYVYWTYFRNNNIDRYSVIYSDESDKEDVDVRTDS